MNILSENMKTSKTVVTASNDIACEWDIIVPDSKPDIRSVLTTDIHTSITGHEVMQDRAMVNGIVKLNILYISEEEIPCVKSIETSQNFSHVMELKGLRQNMDLSLETSVASSSSNVINSRKINFTSSITLNACVMDQNEMEFISSVEEESIQTLTKELKTYKAVCEGSNEIVLSDILEVPIGNPAISDILKVDVSLSDKEIKPINNKMVVKGELCVATLYNNADEGLYAMEHQIPFTEILDVDGMQENCECDTDFIITNTDYFVQEDEDEARRHLCVEATVKVNTKSYENVTFQAMIDAYSTKHEINVEKTAYSVDEITEEINTQLLHKADVRFEDIPKIQKIYHFHVTPSIESILVTDGNIRIQGQLFSELLYTSSDSDQPLCKAAKAVPFTHNLPCDSAKNGIACEAKIELIHAGYHITDESAIELRTTLNFRARLKNRAKNNLIRNIAINEEKTLSNQRPGIIIYFCGESEKLWDIAKKYRTTVNSIIEANSLSENKEIVSGVRLLIP